MSLRTMRNLTFELYVTYANVSMNSMMRQLTRTIGEISMQISTIIGIRKEFADLLRKDFYKQGFSLRYR